MVSPSANQNEPPRPVQELHATNRRLLETSPQRRAFSHILRMLNSANEAKTKCEDEKQRLVPKLLRVLKQARKENSQLTKTHELALQKARRDALASTKIWEIKMHDLKESQESCIRDFRVKLDEKDTESHVMRKRCENLMDEIVLLKKRNTTLETEKVEMSIQLKSAVSIAEQNVSRLLKEQTNARRAELELEKKRNEELQATYAAHAKTLEQQHKKALDDLGVQVLHAVTSLQEMQSRSRSGEIIDWTGLRQEMIGITHSIEEKNITAEGASSRKRSRENPKSLHDNTHMDIDQCNQPISFSSSADITASSSSMFESLRLKIAHLQESQDSQFHHYQEALERKVASLEMNLENERSKYENANKEILELTATIATKEIESRNTRRKHDEEIATLNEATTTLDQKLDSCMKELLKEAETNAELRAAVESLKNEHMENTAAIQRQMSEQEKDLMNLRIQLRQKTDEMATAQDHIVKLKTTVEELESRSDGLVKRLALMNDKVNDEINHKKALEKRIMQAEHDHIREQHQLEEELNEQTMDLDRLRHLYEECQQRKVELETELSTQVLSTEAASEAEVAVLKQYVRELEVSIEDSNSSLNTAKARQLELIDQLERLQSHVRHLGSSPSKVVGSEKNQRGEDYEDGKENISIPSQNEDSKSSSGFSSAFSKSSKRKNLDSTPFLPHSNTVALSRQLFAGDNDETNARGTNDQSDNSMDYEEYPVNRLALFPSPSRELQESVELPTGGSFGMGDWRERCLFLQHDRDELVRVTDEIIEHEKESHKLQLHAAMAAANREALERESLLEEQTRSKMKYLYDALCSDCRRKIDTA